MLRGGINPRWNCHSSISYPFNHSGQLMPASCNNGMVSEGGPRKDDQSSSIHSLQPLLELYFEFMLTPP